MQRDQLDQKKKKVHIQNLALVCKILSRSVKFRNVILWEKVNLAWGVLYRIAEQFYLASG